MESTFFAWHIWFLFAAILFVAEMLTGTFVLLCFGIACTVSAICAAFFLNAGIQWLVFGIVSSFSLLFFLKRKTKNISTKVANSERLIGLIGIVTKKIPEFDSGIVTIRGEEWSAISEDHGQIEINQKVLIKEISGVKLIVSKEI